MKSILSCSFKIVVFIVGFHLMGQQAIGQEEKFKALFIYNFTKYIEWPADMGGDAFNIAIVGNKDLYNQLTEISNKMKVGNKKMNVTFYSSINEAPFCHIIYIGTAKPDEITNYAKKVKGSKVLIICDKENACQKGACINFIKKNGNLNYEISKSNMESANLKCNSALTVLGTSVD